MKLTKKEFKSLKSKLSYEAKQVWDKLDNGGRDSKFWKLTQAFSNLYPNGSDEKRWVDGVLARKRGLGL